MRKIRFVQINVARFARNVEIFRFFENERIFFINREWVPETCAEDLEATVFVQFGDEDEQRHVAEELFDIYNDLGAPFGEVDVEDIFVTVQEVFGIIGHFGAANVCDLISDVLSTEA